MPPSTTTTSQPATSPPEGQHEAPAQQTHPPTDPSHHVPPQRRPTILNPTGSSDRNSYVSDAPPFWSRHGRTLSSVSYHSISNSVRQTPIRLEDHSEEDHIQSQSCWASSVTIDDHVVVSGVTGVGAYVVWHCTVKTIKGGDMALRKRYSEFDQLRDNLVRSFPHAGASVPELPRKSLVSRFRPKFLEARRTGLQHFMNCVLLNPEFASSPVLKEFVFS